MRPFTRQLSLWLPLGLYIALIFFLSSRSLPAGARFAPDYILHGLEYMALGTFMVRAMNNGVRKPVAPATLVWSLAACIVLAVLDELTQRSVPTRVASFSDLAADGVGAAIAIIVVRMAQAVLVRPVPTGKG